MDGRCVLMGAEYLLPMDKNEMFIKDEENMSIEFYEMALDKVS